VELLHVDGIPHVAFVDKDANLVTTLLGAIPEATLLGDAEALAEVRQATFVRLLPLSIKRLVDSIYLFSPQGRPLPVMGLQAPLDNLRDLCR
jgi:hypothetical protein